jgi:1-acyl-sn-glycerol-3-phosphate acyltransferase
VAQRAFYWLMTRLTRLVVWTVGRYEVVGVERVPQTGALVVVANHLNNADPPLVGASIPRRIRFMAKQELFDAKPFGFFIRLFGAFPVRRFEADLQALREAQRLLSAGAAIGMFPEGHRSRGKGMQQPFPGTALIALRSGATILPVGITGTEAITTPLVLFRKPPIRVVIGEPFTLPQAKRVTAEAVRDGADEIMCRIAELLPPKYRGLYADPSARVARSSRDAAPAVAMADAGNGVGSASDARGLMGGPDDTGIEPSPPAEALLPLSREAGEGGGGRGHPSPEGPYYGNRQIK